MKHIAIVAILATALTGCNAMTSLADSITNKQSTFSQRDNTIYPTVDGRKDSEPAEFGKAKYSIAPADPYAQEAQEFAEQPTDYGNYGVVYGQ